MICLALLQSSFLFLVGLDLSKFQQLLHFAPHVLPLLLSPLPTELVLVPSLSLVWAGVDLWATPILLLSFSSSSSASTNTKA